MPRPHLALRSVAIAFAILALPSALAPARADTTVAQFLELETAEQAHLLGSLLQSLVESLEQNKRGQEAECLIQLYTNRESEARVVRSPGMTDFLKTVEVAREKGADKFTIEEIIARQMVQKCGTKQPDKG